MTRTETYLDHNASAPLLPEARDALVAALDLGPGNASSAHAAGRRLRRVLGDAREAVADLVGAKPGEVVFTSGATEANHLGILGALAALPPPRRILVTTQAEHQSVRQLAERLARTGTEVRWAGVDRAARVSPDEVAALAGEDAGVVAVTLAQSITGTLQPVAEIAALLAGRGALLHGDGAQLAGRLPLDVGQSGVDLLALSAHKLGGPHGIGALVVRDGRPFRHPSADGAQELGRRPGTEAVALAAGFGAAARVAAARVATTAARDMRTALAPLRRFVAEQGGAQVLSPEGGLPNTCLVAFDGCPGDALLAALDARGIRVSTGSACASGARTPPAVLLAAGYGREESARALRVSVGADTPSRDVERLVDALRDALPRVRAALARGYDDARKKSSEKWPAGNAPSP